MKKLILSVVAAVALATPALAADLKFKAPPAPPPPPNPWDVAFGAGIQSDLDERGDFLSLGRHFSFLILVVVVWRSWS